MHRVIVVGAGAQLAAALARVIADGELERVQVISTEEASLHNEVPPARLSDAMVTFAVREVSIEHPHEPWFRRFSQRGRRRIF